MALIHVLIVDAHAVVREGVRLLFQAAGDMHVVGLAGSAREALALEPADLPDVVVCETHLPDGGGISFLGRFRARWPRARVLFLTGRDDPTLMRTALAAGACGYVDKRATPADLYAAVRAVAQGRMFVDAYSGLPPEVTPATGTALSAREVLVLKLIANGHSQQQIAERLDLSVKTVNTYRQRLGEKLGLKRRSDLVRYALETGLLAESPAV